MDDDYDQRKPLLSGRYKLYTDSTDSSINVNVEIQKSGSGVTFRKHITLFGAIGILTGIQISELIFPSERKSSRSQFNKNPHPNC